MFPSGLENIGSRIVYWCGAVCNPYLAAGWVELFVHGISVSSFSAVYLSFCIRNNRLPKQMVESNWQNRWLEMVSFCSNSHFCRLPLTFCFGWSRQWKYRKIYGWAYMAKFWVCHLGAINRLFNTIGITWNF